MKDGIANIDQTIKLPVNMYLDYATNLFIEKKVSIKSINQSAFNFTMNTPKGEKSAGAVYVDLGVMLNQKLEFLEKDFPLEKCPVKESYVHMRISGEMVGEKDTDTQSQNESFAVDSSLISIPGEESPTKKSGSEKKQ